MSFALRLCRPYGNSVSRTGVPPWMASVSSFVGKVLISGGGRNRLRGAGFRRYQLFQFATCQPAFVRVARITEAFRKRLGADPPFRFAPRLAPVYYDNHF